MLLIQLPVAQAQLLNPQDTVKSIDRSLEDLGSTNLAESNIGEDIIINVDSYQPKLITSDIIEAQNVDIMAQLKGTLTNPTITVPKIRSISVRSTNVTTVPSGKKVSVGGIRYYKPKDSDLSFDNLGYLAIRINKIPVEADIPEKINIAVQATLDFDVSEGLGIKQYEAVLQPDEEKDSHKFFGGYLSASQIGPDYAVFDLHDTQLKPIFKDLKIAENGLSQSLSYSNFAGPSSFGRLFDRFKIKLNDVREVGDRATFIIDGEQTVILSKGQPAYPGSRWIVEDIQISDAEAYAKVILKDRADKKGLKKVEFIIDNSQKFTVTKVQVGKVIQIVETANYKKESEVLNLNKDQRFRYIFNEQEYEFYISKLEKSIDANYVEVYVIQQNPYKQWKDYSLKSETIEVNPYLSFTHLTSSDNELPIYLKVDKFDQANKDLYFTIYSQKTSSLKSQSLKLVKGTPLEFTFENNEYKFTLTNDFDSQNEKPEVIVSYNKPSSTGLDFVLSNNPPENLRLLLSPLQNSPIRLELIASDADKGSISFKILQSEKFFVSASAMVSDGLPLNVQDKYKQAIESYQKVIDELPNEKDENNESASAMAKMHIGGIYVKLGQYSNAVSYLKQSYSELKDGAAKRKVSQILDLLEVKKKDIVPSVQYLDEDSGKVQFVFIDFKKASLTEAATATFEFNQNNQKITRTFKEGDLIKDQTSAFDSSFVVNVYQDSKVLQTKLFKFNTYMNNLEFDGNLPKVTFWINPVNENIVEVKTAYELDNNKPGMLLQKDKTISFNLAGLRYEVKLTDLKTQSSADTEWQILEVKDSSIKLMNTLDKNFQKTVSISNFVDSSTRLVSVNVLREAYITVIPDVERAYSTANFNLHIGIEGRPFGLPLFSKTIDEEINKTQKLIDKLDSIIVNAKKLHNFWIKFCFITFGVLWSKNFFMNLVGASRDNLARDKINEKWENKWREEGKGSYDKFVFDNQNAYESDLANAGKVIDKIMDNTYKNELPKDLFIDQKAKDSEEAKDWYFSKKFAETNKNDPRLQLTFAERNTELYKQKLYTDVEKQLYSKDAKGVNKPKSYAQLTPEMKKEIDSYMNVPYYTNGKDISTLTDVERANIYDTDTSYFMKQYKETEIGRQWDSYFKDGGGLSKSLQDNLKSPPPSKEFTAQIRNKYAPKDLPSYTKQVVVDPRSVFIVKDFTDDKGIKSDYFAIKLEDGSTANLRAIDSAKDIGVQKFKDGEKWQVGGIDYLVSTNEAYSLQNHKGLVSFLDSGTNKGKLQAISLDARWYIEPVYSSTGTVIDYVVWERPEDNAALGGGARIGSLNEVLDQQEKKAEKYKNRIEFKDRASRLESVRTCISSVNQKYGKTTIATGEKLAKQCNDLGKYAVSKAVNQQAAAGCTKYMGPSDCKILFNACDPVLCPPSRCNLGGSWKVDNVIQSGIVGSTLLCAPNWVPLGGDIYTLPVCLTGIIGGLENINSNLKSYKECLVTAKVQKTNTGWCSRLRSFFLCDVLWRETIALQRAAVSAVSKNLLGESEGSEYASFSNAFDEASSGLDYFTQDYAKEVFSVYQGGSLPEIGAEICKSFVGGKIPGIGNVLDDVLEPVSPPQFNAFFDESKANDFVESIPGHFGSSFYKTFYHIYAGNNEDVSFSVFLRAVDANEMPIPNYSPIFIERGRTLAKGQFATNNVVKQAASGYNQVCVEIAGDRYGRHSECGFGKASSTFTVDYLADAYAKSQLTKKQIKSAEECVPEQGVSSGFNTNVGAGLITATAGALSTGLLSTGVVRKCSAYNPGIGESDTTWVPVGVCGKDEQGRDLGTCWLYANNAANVIKNNLAALDDVNQEFLEPLKKQLEEKGLGLDLIGKDQALAELKLLKEALDEAKIAKYTDLEFENIIRRYSNLIEGSFLPEILAKSYSGLGLAFYSYGNYLLKLTPTEEARIALEERKKEDILNQQKAEVKSQESVGEEHEPTYLFKIGDKVYLPFSLLGKFYKSAYSQDYARFFDDELKALGSNNTLAINWLSKNPATIVNDDKDSYTIEWITEGQVKQDILNENYARYDLAYSNFNAELTEDQRHVIDTLRKESILFDSDTLSNFLGLKNYQGSIFINDLQNFINDYSYQIKTKNFIGWPSKVDIDVENAVSKDTTIDLKGDMYKIGELLEVIRTQAYEKNGQRLFYYINNDGDVSLVKASTYIDHFFYFTNDEGDVSLLKNTPSDLKRISLRLRFTFNKKEVDENSQKYDSSSPKPIASSNYKISADVIKNNFKGIFGTLSDQAASALASKDAFVIDDPKTAGFTNVFWPDFSSISTSLQKEFIFSNFNKALNAKQLESIGKIQNTIVKKDQTNSKKDYVSTAIGKFNYFSYNLGTQGNPIQIIFKVDENLFKKAGKNSANVNFPSLYYFNQDQSTVSSFINNVILYGKEEYNLDFYPISSSGLASRTASLIGENALIFATPQNALDNLFDLATKNSLSYKLQADGSILLSKNFNLADIQLKTQKIIDNNYIEFDGNVPADLTTSDIISLLKKHGLTLSLTSSDVNSYAYASYQYDNSRIMSIEAKKQPVSAFLESLRIALQSSAANDAILEMQIQPDGSIVYKSKSKNPLKSNSDIIDYLESLKAEFDYNYKVLANGDLAILNVYPKIGYKFKETEISKTQDAQPLGPSKEDIIRSNIDLEREKQVKVDLTAIQSSYLGILGPLPDNLAEILSQEKATLYLFYDENNNLLSEKRRIIWNSLLELILNKYNYQIYNNYLVASTFNFNFNDAQKQTLKDLNDPMKNLFAYPFEEEGNAFTVDDLNRLLAGSLSKRTIKLDIPEANQLNMRFGLPNNYQGLTLPIVFQLLMLQAYSNYKVELYFNIETDGSITITSTENQLKKFSFSLFGTGYLNVLLFNLPEIGYSFNFNDLTEYSISKPSQQNVALPQDIENLLLELDNKYAERLKLAKQLNDYLFYSTDFFPLNIRITSLESSLLSSRAGLSSAQEALLMSKWASIGDKYRPSSEEFTNSLIEQKKKRISMLLIELRNGYSNLYHLEKGDADYQHFDFKTLTEFINRREGELLYDHYSFLDASEQQELLGNLRRIKNEFYIPKKQPSATDKARAKQTFSVIEQTPQNPYLNVYLFNLNLMLMFSGIVNQYNALVTESKQSCTTETNPLEKQESCDISAELKLLVDKVSSNQDKIRVLSASNEEVRNSGKISAEDLVLSLIKEDIAKREAIKKAVPIIIDNTWKIIALIDENIELSKKVVELVNRRNSPDKDSEIKKLEEWGSDQQKSRDKLVELNKELETFNERLKGL